MARRVSTTEFIALTVALVGPMALYVAQTRDPGSRSAAADTSEVPMTVDMSDLEPQAPVTGPVIPWSEAPQRVEREAGGLEIALVSGGRLLLQTEVPRSWGRGKIRGAKDRGLRRWAEDYMYAEKGIDPDEVSETWRALEGTRVDLYGPAGKVCTASIGELTVVAEVNGESWGYAEDVDFHEDGTVTPAGGRKIRRRVWKQAERWLMADLEGFEACEGARFGRSASLPAPDLLTPRDTAVDKSLRREFMARAKSELEIPYQSFLAEWRASRTGSDAEPDEDWPEWSKFVRETYAHRVYVDGRGQARAAYQLVGDVESSCGWGFGDYRSEVTAMGPTPTPTETPTPGGAGVSGFGELMMMSPPALFVDSDGDGRFEMLSDGYEAALYDADGTWIMSGERPYEGCPC